MARPHSSRLVALVLLLLGALVAGSLTLPASAYPGGDAVEQPPGTVAEITQAGLEAWLAEAVPRLSGGTAVDGLAVAVVRDGEVLAQHGPGAPGSAGPVDPETSLFPFGSVTKVVNAAAVMRLVDEGRVNLDADVRDLIDLDLDLPLGAVTLRHLLSHTAGFEEQLEEVFVPEVSSVRSLREVVQRQPRQVYAPGTVIAYSNYSASVAGYVIEQLSGRPWADYVTEEILAPLGMSSTSAEQPLPPELGDRLIRHHPRGGSQPRAMEYLSDTPAGVLAGTVTDLAALGTLLAGDGDGLLSARTHTMWTADEPLDSLGTLSGGGFMHLGLAHSPASGPQWIGHAGDTVVHHASLRVWPQEGLVFAALVSGAPIAEPLADEFQRTSVTGPPPVAPADEADPVAGEQAAAVAARTWTSSRRNPSTLGTVINPTIAVSAAKDGSLTFAGTRFHWVRDWLWVSPDDGEVIAVAVDDAGRARALQAGPYFTFIPGGASTLTVGVVGAIGLLGWLISGIIAGVVWLRGRRGHTVGRPPAWQRVARHLAGWGPVLVLLALTGKVAAVEPVLSTFLRPGAELAVLSAQPVLDMLGAVLMGCAALSVLAAGTLVVVRARAGRRRAAIGWGAVVVLAGLTLWALDQVALLRSPLLI